MSSIRGLVSVTTLYFGIARDLKPLEAWLPGELYQRAISGILKQAAERLDVVRQVAVEGIIQLLQCETPPFDDTNRWAVQGENVIRRELVDTYVLLSVPSVKR